MPPVRHLPESQQGLFQPGIESIAQPIPEKVEAQHGHEDGQPRTERQPGLHLNPGYIGLQVPAPTRCWRRVPKPRKLSEASTMMAVAILSVPVTIMGVMQLGRMCHRRIRGSRCPTARAGFDILLFLHRQHRPTHQTRINRNTHNANGHNDLHSANEPGGGGKHDHNDNGQQKDGKDRITSITGQCPGKNPEWRCRPGRRSWPCS